MHLLVNVVRRPKRVSNIFLSLLFLGMPLMLSACSQPPPPPPPPPAEVPPPPFQHVVKYSGETLGLIAKWYTGKSQNWQLLRQANPNLNPNRISIGDVVSIPNEMVTRRDALPKNAVSKWISAASTMEKKETDTAVEPTSDEATLSKGTMGEPPANPPTNVTGAAEVTTGGSKSGPEDLDALEKELESALAERGKQKTPPAAATEPAKGGTKGDEAEREKLLDELLAQ